MVPLVLLLLLLLTSQLPKRAIRALLVALCARGGCRGVEVWRRSLRLSEVVARSRRGLLLPLLPLLLGLLLSGGLCGLGFDMGRKTVLRVLVLLLLLMVGQSGLLNLLGELVLLLGLLLLLLLMQQSLL